MNRVTGNVLLHERGVGIPNLVVTIYDVDSDTLPQDAIQSGQTSLLDLWERLQGERLGSVLTDPDGTFVLEYEHEAVNGERPDLLLFVTAPEGPGPDRGAPVLHVSSGIRQNAGRIESYLIRLTAEALTARGCRCLQFRRKGRSSPKQSAGAFQRPRCIRTPPPTRSSSSSRFDPP